MSFPDVENTTLSPFSLCTRIKYTERKNRIHFIRDIFIYIFFFYENKRAFRRCRARLYFFPLISPLRYGVKKSNRNSLYYNIIIHKLSDYILIDATRGGISFKMRIKVYRSGPGTPVWRMLSFRSVVCLSSVFIVIIIIFFSVILLRLKYNLCVVCTVTLLFLYIII